MIRNKIKYFIPLIVATCLVPTILTPSIIIPVLNSSNISKSVNNVYYLYDNQYFNSLEEATKYAMVKYKPINSDLYLGNAKAAIFDLETGRININELRKLTDYSRIKPAYKNALGNYTYDYDAAKKSFINPGLIQYKYDDLNGKLFNSREEAKESMISKTNSIPITYHKLTINNQEVKFNPFSYDDINELKVLSLSNSIIYNNNFSLSIYGRDNSSSYSNKIDHLFSYKYSIYELLDFLINQYFRIKWNFLKNEAKFEVKLTLNGMGKANEYRFESFNPGSNNQDIKVQLLDSKICNYLI